ncbi:hypothetical protein RI129_010056 [Pyrocoelia pectoralis]|uniref:O-acyltransferase n=1 Tax=Pyrocoelia pectoralis TaxID=417401 RepID=A0AAN7VDR3_9COLE
MSTKDHNSMQQEARHEPSEEKDNLEKKFIHKTFQARNSLMTDLMKDKNAKTLYNVWPGFFLCTMLYSALKDYECEGRPYFGTRLLKSAFLHFDFALMIWFYMFLPTLCVYYGFLFWAQKRIRMQYKYLWDRTFLAFFLFYVTGMCCFSTRMVFVNNLGPASSMAVMIEMVRFIMKSYAYIRTNCPKFINKEKDGTDPICPTFSRFWYFLFAPTLVYRDVYPRSIGIRWSMVATGIAEIVSVVFFGSVALENTYVYHLKDYGLRSYSVLEIITLIIQYFPAGLFGYFLFHCFCHSYMNTTAELLTFSDRLFYKDWWTTNNAYEFLAKWNIFVFDWLYIYVYKDLYVYVFPERKYMIKLVMLILNATVHDLIICVSCRHFLPLFLFNYTFIVVTRNILNSNKVWLCLLGSGASFLNVLLVMEYYARINCPIHNATILENIKPRFLYC